MREIDYAICNALCGDVFCHQEASYPNCYKSKAVKAAIRKQVHMMPNPHKVGSISWIVFNDTMLVILEMIGGE